MVPSQLQTWQEIAMETFSTNLSDFPKLCHLLESYEVLA